MGSVLLIPILVQHFYLGELTILMIALAFKAIALALANFTMETWMMYINIPLEMMTGLGMSCLVTVIVKLSKQKDTKKILCLAVIGWIVVECVSRLVTRATIIALYSTYHGSVFVMLTATTLTMFGVILWLSADLKTYHHKTLLDNVKISTADDSDVVEVDAEQWLLDAYKHSDTSDGDVSDVV